MDRDSDRWVRSAEAQAKFRDLLDEVAQGEHVYVLRYDKPAAVMVPVDWYERMTDAEVYGFPEDKPGPRAAPSADPRDPIMKRLAGLPPETDT